MAIINELTKGLDMVTELWCLLDEESSPLSELCDEVIATIENGISLLNTSATALPMGLKRPSCSKDEQMQLRKKQNTEKALITDSPFSDPHEWRKYGEKTIGNSKFRRCYYRCKFDGCKGKMKVQQINCNEFPEYEVTTTVGHTCNTTSRNQTLPPTNIEVPKSSGFQRRTFDNGVFSSRETLSSSIDFSCNDQDLNNLMAFIE